MKFFATAPRGTESILAEELMAHGAAGVREVVGGVEFSGELESGYRCCLWSRVASRVLLVVAQAQIESVDALYAWLRELPWEEHVAPGGSIAVDFVGGQQLVDNSHFGALRVKDAIVDRFSERFGQRPNVALTRPDVRVNVHIKGRAADVSIDLSGESLHRRGYRVEGVAAPLKENLAAALLLRARWPEIAAQGGTLVDPMCGSGTLLIEGAMIAADRAPGALRDFWGFTGWRGHDEAVWQGLLREAEERARAGGAAMPKIVGYEKERSAVHAALDNCRQARVERLVHIERRDVADVEPPGGAAPGLLIANPPYGERLGSHASLVPLYATLGEVMSERFVGWKAAIFTSDLELGKRIPLRARRMNSLFNGAIPCKLLHFDVEPRWFHAVGELHLPPEVAAALRRETLSDGAEMFANRLRKNLRLLGRQAEREGVDCYRLYDADMPEYSLAIDLYRGERLWVHLQEYEAPKKVEEAKARERLLDAVSALPKVLGIAPSDLFFKVRRRQKGKSQYEKNAEQGRFFEVREGECRLLVNLSDYLDTGLFLDHRAARMLVGELAEGGDFLNLFGYTGAASVHAAVGGAVSTTTVDMSATYLAWAERNLALNGFSGYRHRLVQADCLVWLAEQARRPERRYDLIFLDPPTFSSSKRMEQSFDVQRDHVALIRNAVRLLAPGGVLLFSNNNRRFDMDREALAELIIEDITARTIPFDFARNPRIHNCWRITREEKEAASPWGRWAEK